MASFQILKDRLQTAYINHLLLSRAEASSVCKYVEEV